MRRLLTASALLALALFTTTAFGQPPGGANKQQPAGKADKKPADPTDVAIATALANDPDVRMAKAKIQLAEAELAKARQAVTLRVVSLKAKIEQAKAEVRVAQERVAHVTQQVRAGIAPQPELLGARDKLESAKAALALAEAEWKLLTGGVTVAADVDAAHEMSVAHGLAWLRINSAVANEHAMIWQYIAARSTRPVVQGPISERLRAALDKPVKLGAKGEKVTFTQALDVIMKEAGLNVPVRSSPEIDELGKLVSEGEEMPLGAWLQLIEDHAVITLPWDGTKEGPPGKKRFRFYVREYGLLFVPTDAAPPDAPTLTEFWKQKLPTKETKPEPASK